MSRKALAWTAFVVVLTLIAFSIYRQHSDPSEQHVFETNAKILSKDCYSFAVSHDGREVAYIGHDGLIRLSLDDGRQEKLARVKGDHNNSILAWSPDGTRLAIITKTVSKEPRPQDRRSTGTLIVFDLERHQSVELDKAATIDGLAWSPDSKKLCWTKIELTSEWTFTVSIVTASADGHNPSRTILSLNDTSKRLFGLTWNRDNIIIELDWYEYPAQRHEIRTLDLNGKVVRSVNPDFGKHLSVTGSVTSHDTRSIIYLVWGNPFRYDVAEGKIYPVGDYHDAYMVRWTPDDRGLVILNAAGKGYNMPPGAPSIRTAPPYDLSVISTDGKRIAGPFIINRGEIRGMQCTSQRRIIYRSGNRLFMQAY